MERQAVMESSAFGRDARVPLPGITWNWPQREHGRAQGRDPSSMTPSLGAVLGDRLIYHNRVATGLYRSGAKISPITIPTTTAVAT